MLNKNILLFLFISTISVSCSEKKKNAEAQNNVYDFNTETQALENDKEICQSLYSILDTKDSRNYISNGCSSLLNKLPAKNETVLLQIRPSDFAENKFVYCTGVIIGNHSVLTSASCLYDKEKENNTLNSIILGNKFEINNDSQYIITEKNIKEIYIHPLYKNSDLLLLGNIAIIQSDINFLNLGLAPKKIYNKNELQKNIITVGYGSKKDELVDFSDIKQRYKRWTINYLSKADYPLSFSNFTNEKFYLDKAVANNDVDAPNSDNFQDYFIISEKKNENSGNTCFDDIGAPQLMHSENNWGVVAVFNSLHPGIININTELKLCPNANKRVNTNVIPYINWMRKTLNKYGDILDTL